MSTGSPPASTTQNQDRSFIPLGIFCIVFGVGAVFIARAYPYGTLTEMGPGFIPTAIGIMLSAFGVLILALRGSDVQPDQADEDEGKSALAGVLRAIFMILGAIVLFGILLRPVGLPISTFLLVMVASYARRDAELLPSLLTAVVLSILACILFVVLLGINIPMRPGFL